MTLSKLKTCKMVPSDLCNLGECSGDQRKTIERVQSLSPALEGRTQMAAHNAIVDTSESSRTILEAMSIR